MNISRRGREIDPERIGVMALSLGGYYAPRAAALEPRFACCVAWGAQWDYHAIWRNGFDDLAAGKVLSLSVPPEHLQWVLGVESRGRAQETRRFQARRHRAEDDVPIPTHARRRRRADPAGAGTEMFDAVGSKEKTLKVFTREEGGFHHCQVDNITIGAHYVGLAGRCAQAGRLMIG